MKHKTGEKVIEGNKLIARFVKARLYEHENYYGEVQWWAEYPDETKPPHDSDNIHSCNGLQYHTSWDWQVPVWSKLITGPLKTKALEAHNDIGYNRLIDEYSLAIRYNKPLDGFNLIVKAIEWYNQQTK